MSEFIDLTDCEPRRLAGNSSVFALVGVLGMHSRRWAGVGLEIARDQRIYRLLDLNVLPRQQHGLIGEFAAVEEQLTGALGRVRSGDLEARGQITMLSKIGGI